MSTTTAIRTQEFPKVNLLPGEIAEEQQLPLPTSLPRAVRRGSRGSRRRALVRRYQSVSSAEESTSRQRRANRPRCKPKWRPTRRFPRSTPRSTAAEAALDLAMGNEIRYSFVLNDLSLTIPVDVWLTRSS